MPTFNMTSEVNSKTLIDYGLFSVIDSIAARDPLPVSDLEASAKIINLKLRNIGWQGYKEKVDNKFYIGYHSSNETLVHGAGLLEQQAYYTWIEEFKDKERKFKKALQLPTMSQSQYDALLSLYFDTGTINTIGTQARLFQITDFINNRQWDYVATAMTLAGENRLMRQQEAKVLMLADYGITKDRSLIKEQGLQTLLKNYSTMGLADEQKSQAEYVYYAETKRFLPNLTESRKRILAKQLS